MVARSLVWPAVTLTAKGFAGCVYSSGGLPPVCSCDMKVPAAPGPYAHSV